MSDNLSKSFGTGRAKVRAVEDVSVDIFPGQLVLIMGPSGSGKTTLAHLIARHTKAHFVPFSAVTGGIPELREAVVNDIQKYRGVKVDKENVMIVPGGKPTMFFAITMFGEAGTEIMYPNPGFPIYESMIEFSGAKAVPIELLESNGLLIMEVPKILVPGVFLEPHDGLVN